MKAHQKAKSYDHRRIEAYWQKVWAKEGLGRATALAKKKKAYLLVEFPYPSGEGLHVGHVRGYTALDAVARKRRMQGENVLYPIGWDAFGLPTENYAIQTGQDPRLVTKQNTDNFRRQLKALGISFDWSREINTTDPAYYRWTQWIFLQFFKRGLAYKARAAINWCPKDKIGLANEEVVDGRCERCGASVEQREKEQWFLKITAYAGRLLKDLQGVDYWPEIKKQQENWIGRQEGAVVRFQVLGSGEIEVFTTRPETIFGATYLAISGRVDRFSGKYAVNPATKAKIPIWEAEYVMSDVGTGTVMGVPAHDQRDFEFAKKYNLPIKMVVCPNYPAPTCPILDRAYTAAGYLVDSGQFNGRQSEEVKGEIIKFVGGEKTVRYKLRDWLFSRQRYWGEPIPLVFCENCKKWQPVPEKDLPVQLPKVQRYTPTETGESPLAKIKDWVNTTCPQCGGAARRETDVMPNWAGSSWYYLRYCDPKNRLALASRQRLNYWLPVDWYNGGMEHTNLHLLYSRFWHKFLFDLGLVPSAEPYVKRTSHGLILAKGGVKMSKSLGNVINPDEIVKRFGADTLRVYEMFMGPFDQAIAWSTHGLVGARRFLERVWRLASAVADFSLAPEPRRQPGQNSEKSATAFSSLLHRSVKKISDDIETMKFNTAVSQLMILLNDFEKQESPVRSDFEIFVKLLSPFAPHLTEEIWRKVLKNKKPLHSASWPMYDSKRLRLKEVTVAVQVNGKVRGRLVLPAGQGEQEVTAQALDDTKIKKWLAGRAVKKTIFIKDKLLNFVV